MKYIRKDLMFVKDVIIGKHYIDRGYSKRSLNVPVSIPTGKYDLIFIPKN